MRLSHPEGITGLATLSEPNSVLGSLEWASSCNSQLLDGCCHQLPIYVPSFESWPGIQTWQTQLDWALGQDRLSRMPIYFWMLHPNSRQKGYSLSYFYDGLFLQKEKKGIIFILSHSDLPRLTLFGDETPLRSNNWSHGQISSTGWKYNKMELQGWSPFPPAPGRPMYWAITCMQTQIETSEIQTQRSQPSCTKTWSMSVSHLTGEEH